MKYPERVWLHERHAGGGYPTGMVSEYWHDKPHPTDQEYIRADLAARACEQHRREALEAREALAQTQIKANQELALLSTKLVQAETIIGNACGTHYKASVEALKDKIKDLEHNITASCVEREELRGKLTQAQEELEQAKISEIALRHELHDTHLDAAAARATNKIAFRLLQEAKTDVVGGCRFCDMQGKLRNPDKGHDPDCWYARVDTYPAAVAAT